MTINLRTDAPSQVTQTNPEKLSEEIQKLLDVQSKIQHHEDLIKDLKQDEKYFSEVVIPEMMNDMNLKTMKLKDGSEIEVSNKFFATALAEKKAEAYQWLRENGLGNIVKNEITVRFGKDEDNKAQQYATLARGQGYEPEQKVAVHASTLRVALEDLHTRGGKIPSEYFSTFDGYKTKITNKPKSTD